MIFHGINWGDSRASEAANCWIDLHRDVVTKSASTSRRSAVFWLLKSGWPVSSNCLSVTWRGVNCWKRKSALITTIIIWFKPWSGFERHPAPMSILPRAKANSQLDVGRKEWMRLLLMSVNAAIFTPGCRNATFRNALSMEKGSYRQSMIDIKYCNRFLFPNENCIRVRLLKFL